MPEENKSRSCPETIVFDIEKFAVRDGPGIRTVVFLKGCPLRCLWCHNPESQAFGPEILFDPEKCFFCGKCVAVCPEHCHSIADGRHSFRRTECARCGRCVENCPPEALKTVGRKMNTREVLGEVMKDLAFYRNSGGGVTLSGGEPLASFEFSSELLRAAKNAGLHTAVETSGFASWDRIRELLPLVDLWLWDVKTVPEKHEKLTGVSAEPILENLRKLDRSGASIILRCPLVPGVNDTDAELRHIAELANEHSHIWQIDLEPYHPLGEEKSSNLGRNHVFHADFSSEANKIRWLETISSLTRTAVHI